MAQRAAGGGVEGSGSATNFFVSVICVTVREGGWRREGIGHGYEFFKFIMPHYTFVGSATYIRQLTNKYIMSMFIDSKYLPRFFSIEKYILIIFLGTKEYKITETQTRMIMLQKPNAMSIHARPAISTPNGCAWG
jgi:hypothetical protein